jgi:hypothetical protein
VQSTINQSWAVLFLKNASMCDQLQEPPTLNRRPLPPFDLSVSVCHASLRGRFWTMCTWVFRAGPSLFTSVPVCAVGLRQLSITLEPVSSRLGFSCHVISACRPCCQTAFSQPFWFSVQQPRLSLNLDASTDLLSAWPTLTSRPPRLCSPRPSPACAPCLSHPAPAPARPCPRPLA